jgi:GNAT superfamily N-acetyltransferase
MNKITFCKTQKSELLIIHDLAEQIWRAYYPGIITNNQIEYMLKMMYSIESLEEQFKKNHQFYIAYENEKPIGFASVSTTDGKKWFLHKFYILPDKHGKGIGTRFLQFLEKECKPETMELTVNRQNFKSINFYFKNGFKIVKVQDFDIGEGFQMNDFVMRKVCSG